MHAHLKILAAAAMTAGTLSIGWAQSNTATGSENQVQSAADRAGDATNRAADRAGAAVDKAASGQGVHGTAEAPDAEGIRDVLAATTEATLKGSFSDVVERFVDADRNRLGKAMPGDDALRPLNDLKKQFRDDWKAKYNQEFDIEKEELVFNPAVRIIQGEFGEARTAGERSGASSASDKSSGDRAILGNTDLQTMPDKKGPRGGIDLTDAADQDRANRASGSNISGSSNTGGSQSDRNASTPSGTNATPSNGNVGTSGEGDSRLGRAVDRTGKAVGEAADKTGDAITAGAGRARDAVTGDLDSNREKGRNIATVTLPANRELPAINVPLIHELPDNWRIDIPDDLDAARLAANLQKQLKKAYDEKAQWPADANEGYLHVAHHVLLAIFEGTPHVQPSGAGTDAQPAAGTISPSATPATPAAAQ